MGCTQTSPPVVPYNHVPIERIYVNTVHPVVATPASLVPPVPTYVKGVLKKPHPYGRSRPEPLRMSRSKPMVKMRTVNFEETVLVKPRTPTPDKIWYEKASTTMPMRKDRRNNDDDDDTASVSSDEEVTDQASNQSNTMSEQDYSSNEVPQAPSNLNTYTTDRSRAPPSSRIKVRRRLPDLGPPQVIPTHPYQPPTPSSTQPITVPRSYAPMISSYQHSLIHAPTTSSQPTTLQHPTQLLANSIPSTAQLNQSSIPPLTTSSYPIPMVYSSVPLIHNAAPSSNASLSQQPSMPLTPLSQVK